MIKDTITLFHLKEKCVHIFKFLIFISTFLGGQSSLVNIPSIKSHEISDTLFLKLTEQKDLSSIYELDSFSLEQKTVSYRLSKIPKTLDTLIIPNTSNLSIKVLQQVVSPYKMIPIGEKFNEVGEKLVSRYYFLESKPKFKFGKVADGLGALILLNPKFENQFVGLLGFNNESENWKLNGQINIHLENLTYSADSFDLKWKRIDSLSQHIQLGFSFPHPFGRNVGIEWRYNHDIIEGLYTIIENRSLLQTFIPGLHLVKLGFTRGITRPTDKGLDNSYEKIIYNSFSFSSTRDSRNNRLLPSAGSFLHTLLDVGLQEDSGFLKSEFEIQIYAKIIRELNGSVRWVGKGIKDFSSSIPKSRYFLYGGASSLRGYREQEFFSTQFQVLSLETGFQPNRAIKTIFFIDCGSEYLNIFQKNTIGYGFGLTQINDNSIIRLQYGLSKNSSFSNGKLHLRWLSRF